MKLLSSIVCLVTVAGTLATATAHYARAATLDEGLLRQRAGQSETYTGEVRALLAKSTSPNVPDYNGRTAVHAAASIGAVETMRALLEAGGDPNVRDADGNTPLHFAADASQPTLMVRASIATIRLLLDAGADADLANAKGRTALHLAAASHDLNGGVAALLRAGADANRKDRNGDTPLHAALAPNGWPGVVEALLDGGADPGRLNGNGLTALQLFVRVGPGSQGDTVAVLIDAGADPDRIYPNGDAPLHAAIRSGGNRGKVEVAEALLAGGADPCVRDAMRYIPYHIAPEGGAIHRALDRAGGYDLACDKKGERRIAGSDRTDRSTGTGLGEALEPKCADLEEGAQCWEEIAGRPGCSGWNEHFSPSAGRHVSWSGRCSGGVIEGEGTLGYQENDGTVHYFKGSFWGGHIVGELTWTATAEKEETDQGGERRTHQQQQAQERQAPERPVSRRVTIEGFSLSCPSFSLIGPGMDLGPYARIRRSPAADWTFEIPGEGNKCWQGMYSVFASCEEFNCREKSISQQERDQCIRHFREEATSKCGPDPYK